jgi:ATPase subunit of ABC transporter with duplicated ATPase domains
LGGVLSAKQVVVTRGDDLILDRVSVSIGPGARSGLVGPNGIGKTTLLRVLAGLETPDGGRVERTPASLTVGYLTQEPDVVAGETLLENLARRTGVADAEADLEQFTEAMASDPLAVDAYTDALDRYLALGGADFKARCSSVCADLGLPGDRLDVPTAALSGGQAARAGLAAILLARFDVFLLDEPTNDLDFAGLDRLEAFLGSVPGGVLVVSHDRAFLDRSVKRIVEIEDGTHRAVEFAGGWSEFVERRALARSHQEQAYQAWLTERRRLTERIRRQRSWSEEGVRRAAKRPRDHDKAQRDFFVNRTEKQAAKVRTSERALSRLASEAVDKPWEGWELHLELGSTNRSGDVVARLDGAVVQRGSFRLGPVDLEVGWRDRVAILGPNGGGKSTLLGALLGDLPLSTGDRYLGPGVVVGELDQGRRRFSGDQRVLDVFASQTGLLPQEGRSLLAKFGLGAAHVERRAGQLSPGERTRAILATLMATGVNCLVLDEPANHLDLPAIEQLELALAGFDGTMLVVSHDRWLLESVQFTRTVSVDNGRVSVT